jgi:hypothetical protein
MRNFLLGVLVGSLLAFGVQHGAQWLKARKVPTGAVVQVYAGDDVGAAVDAAIKADQLPPSLYVCNAPDTLLFVLVSPNTLDFALFDGSGAFLTDGVFAKQELKGVKYFGAEVLGTLVAFVEQKDGWHFLVSGEKGVKDFTCL